MELQQMRYALAIAEEQSFTRAAERCFVVQSALSRQIKSLESELGLTLFARTSRKVKVTPAGEAFLEQARLCLQAADRARSRPWLAQGEVRGDSDDRGDSNGDRSGCCCCPGPVPSPAPRCSGACAQRWK